MGYRELLKKYIRHLELTAGDNYIEISVREPLLNKRDLGELRTLAAEIARDAYKGDEAPRIENFNHRLRVLMNRYALTAEQVAELLDTNVDRIQAWRTTPSSDRYRAMSEGEFTAFEQALTTWLESELN
jgi:hypothetical protein